MRQMNRRPSKGFDSCYIFTADQVLVVQAQLKYKNYIEYKESNPPQMEMGAKHSSMPANQFNWESGIYYNMIVWSYLGHFVNVVNSFMFFYYGLY